METIIGDYIYMYIGLWRLFRGIMIIYIYTYRDYYRDPFPRRCQAFGPGLPDTGHARMPRDGQPT